MSRSDLQSKMAVLEAMPSHSLREPSNVPVAEYLREAECMVKAGWRDLVGLESCGFGREWLVDLEVRIGALRQAESNLFACRHERGEAAKLWDKASARARLLVKQLKGALLLAYRRDPLLVARVRAAVKGRSAGALVQNLNNLALLGREHPEPLGAINFDPKRLDEAAAFADRLGELLGRADTERHAGGMAAKIRNAAYSHLKEGLKELRDHALYALAGDKEKKRDYNSRYLRKKRILRKRAAQKAEAAVMEMGAKVGEQCRETLESSIVRVNSHREPMQMSRQTVGDCIEKRFIHVRQAENYMENPEECMAQLEMRRESKGERRELVGKCTEHQGKRREAPEKCTEPPVKRRDYAGSRREQPGEWSEGAGEGSGQFADSSEQAGAGSVQPVTCSGQGKVGAAPLKKRSDRLWREANRPVIREQADLYPLLETVEECGEGE